MSVEGLVIKHAIGILTVAQRLIHHKVTEIETDLVTEADVMGRDGARLPGDLGAARGEHNGVNCCGVEFGVDENGRGHDGDEFEFEWRGGRAPR